jgi:3,4-dihydroxy-2-butanone 4-phosphate synthase
MDSSGDDKHLTPSAERPGGPSAAPADSSSAAVEAALRDLAAGHLVLLLDDSGPHFRGVLVTAADTITPDTINFMVLHGRGLVCVAMPSERLEELGIPMMVDNVSSGSTSAQLPFAVSVDAKAGTTTGTSAADRAVTIRALASPHTRGEDLARPGHVMPIRTVPGGVLTHVAYPEGAVDLVRMAGLSPCSVTCEVLSESGEMAVSRELAELAAIHGLQSVTLRDVARRRIIAQRLTWDGLWPPRRDSGAEITRGTTATSAGSQLGPLSSVSAFIFWVADQDRALDFYVGKLGLVKLRDNEYGPGLRYIEVAVRGSNTALVLLQRSGGGPGSSPELVPRVILGTEDISAAYELLKGRGVQFNRAPFRQSWGGLYAEFVDPDGNVFALSQR